MFTFKLYCLGSECKWDGAQHWYIWSKNMVQSKLKNRRRGNKLKDAENISFTIWFKQAPSSMERIMKENKISKTNYYKIKNDVTIHNLRDIIADEYERNNQLSEEVKESIKAYVKPPTHPITIKELQGKIKEQYGLELTYHQIRTFLKSELKYSYK